LAWYEIDFSYAIIWTMRKLRLIRDVRIPSESDLALRKVSPSVAMDATTEPVVRAKSAA
jgi:hypothetical protein